MTRPLSILVLIFLALPAQAEETRGTLKRVDLSHHRLVIADQDGVEWHFAILDSTDLLLNGETCDLGQLNPGDVTTIRFRLDEEKMTAVLVDAQRRCVSSACPAAQRQRP